MDSAKLIFIGFSTILFIVIPLFIKNVRQYFIALASSMYVFPTGWIFYHQNGLWLADLPILGLLIVSFFSHRKISWIVKPVGWPLLAFIVWGVVCSFGAPKQGWAISELTIYARVYLLMVVLYHNIQSFKDLKIVVFSMLGALLFQVLLGLYQWRFGALGLWFLGERPSAILKWRTRGTFFHPSHYANYLAMVLPVAYRLFLFFKTPDRRQVLLFGSTFFLGLVAFYSTYGRAPWIGFGFAAVMLTLIGLVNTKYKTRITWAFPVLLFFLLIFAERYGGSVIGQFSQRMASYEVRFEQFRNARRLIAANPVLGVGLGNYEKGLSRFLRELDEVKNVNMEDITVHNSYYLIASEQGIPGAILFVIWFITMFYTGFMILRSEIYHPFIINVTLGILGGIAAILIVFTFSPDIHVYHIQYQLGLFAVILIASRDITRRAIDQKNQRVKGMKVMASQSYIGPIRRPGHKEELH